VELKEVNTGHSNEVIIKGKFITGTTVDNEENAKKVVRDLLRDKLRQANCLERDQVFEFVEESIEVNPLRGGGR